MLSFFSALLPAPLRSLLEAMAPRPVSLEERLRDFPTTDLPLQRPVEVRWNRHQVPFITAETDRDLAVALGLVHGHLRGAQIALFKRFFYGRLSEMIGPFGRRLDHAIRILDYGHAVEAIERRLPPDTRAWLEGYVDGLNTYQARQRRWPPEFAALNLKPEPFTVRDILVGSRFAGTDYTWLTYFSLMQHRGRPGFADLWNRTLAVGEVPTSAQRPHDGEAELGDLLLGVGRAGSNSVVVAPQRSASGGALIANDPHLGLTLPNLWILVGLKSPSLDVVGLTIVGLPMIGLGRNRDLAWGGTNLRAASSDLYDVSGLDPAQIESRQTTIRCRFWMPALRTIRETPCGPILTDARIVRTVGDAPIALRWVGHQPTDDFTCFLNAARATSPQSFRQAFAGYGVSGQTMLVADRAGNIGRLYAVTQPVRTSFPKDDPVLDGSDPATHWREFVDATTLPFLENPPEGLIASANNRPEDVTLPIGFTFGSGDRVGRLLSLLRQCDKVTFDDLVALQTDTFAPDAAGLARALADQLDAIPSLSEGLFIGRLRAWDGNYAEHSSGAVAFEILLYHVVTALHGEAKAAELPELFSQWSYLTTFLLSDLLAMDEAARRRLLGRAAMRAAVDAQRFATWGDMHRLRLGSSFARLPILGRHFVLADIPVGGSRQTPMKMAHGLERGVHAATLGSMARHISDLSDPDANHFALLGGQDGWIGSSTYLDQLTLWQERRYIRMPLRRATVEAEFPLAMILQPKP